MFDQPVPEIPGVPAALVAVLRLGLANDPQARPTAVRLRDLLLDLKLDGTDPVLSSPASGADDQTTEGWAAPTQTQAFTFDEPTTIIKLRDT